MRFTEFMINFVKATGGVNDFSKQYGFNPNAIKRYMKGGRLYLVTREYIANITSLPSNNVAI